MESLKHESVSVNRVCRLCLETKDLMWLYDREIEKPENMREIIEVSTGVIISPWDDVSQMICITCFEITKRMFQFRSTSLENDMRLKETAEKNLRKYFNYSIKKVLKKYPGIVLPSTLTDCDISPVVSIDRKEVSIWKKAFEKKLNKNSDTEEENEVNINQSLCPSPTSNEDELPPKLTRVSPVRLVPKLKISIPKLTKEIDSDNYDPISSSIKRRNSEDDGPKPKKNKSETANSEFTLSPDSSLTVNSMTKQVLVCDSCNNIFYNSKELKRHKKSHMRCNLCKSQFRTIQDTKNHGNGKCPIKNMMNSQPEIALSRCDETNTAPEKCERKLPIKVIEPIAILDLISDDENEAVPETIVEGSTSVEKTDRGEDTSSILNKKIDTIISNDPVAAKSFKSERKIVCNDGDGATLHKKTGTISFIKPSVEIIGDDVLDVDMDLDDVVLLKTIIKKVSNSQSSLEIGVQTEMPSQSEIVSIMDASELYRLKNIGRYLNFYKVPIEMSYSNQYSMSVNHDDVPFRQVNPSVITKNTNADCQIPNSVNEVAHQSKTIHSETKVYRSPNILLSTLLSGSSEKTKVSNNSSAFNEPPPVPRESTFVNKGNTISKPQSSETCGITLQNLLSSPPSLQSSSGMNKSLPNSSTNIPFKPVINSNNESLWKLIHFRR